MQYNFTCEILSRKLSMAITTTMARAVLPFFFGIVIHLGLFVRGEWHLKSPAIVTVHSMTFCCMLVVSHSLHQTSSSPMSRTLSDTVTITAAYLTGLLGSIACYRIFFHPLRAFPGPRLAALSKLWHVWKCRDSRGHDVLEDWHQNYGAIVRTGEIPSSSQHLHMLSIYETSNL